MRTCRRCSGNGGKICRVRGPTDRNQRQQLRVICFEVEQLGEIDSIVLRIHGDAVACRRHIGEGVNDVAQEVSRDVGDLVVLRMNGAGWEVTDEAQGLGRNGIAHV